MAITEQALIDKLKRLCRADSQTSVARSLSISDQYLSDILKGRRHISKTLANKLGYNREVITTTVRTYTAIGDK